ncbi:MAG: acyl-CoA thioesterase [Treponema sp.]|jgi:acyl-CoA thioester hydrolase|nr:acyl-CoA thioesterase [Treponema sp.]
MFSTTVSPRFGDVDGLGHINNTVIAAWFELARNPLFRVFDPTLRLNRETWPLIMAHTDYDYINQMFLHEEVELKTWIERIGNKSFTLYHEAWQLGKLCAKGRAVIVHYDFKNGCTTPLPEDKRKFLEEHLLNRE